ncbi:MAG TPA: WD40 repeat domain-containing protein [Gemmata sp.]
MRVLDGTNGWLEPIVISADNRRLAAADRKQRGVRLFDLADGSVRKPYKARVENLCFYPDPDRLALETGKELLELEWVSGAVTRVAALHGDRARAIPGGELATLSSFLGARERVAVTRWAHGTGGKLSRVSETKLGTNQYSYVELWPDASRLIAVLRAPDRAETRGVILSVPGFDQVGEFAIPQDRPGQLLVAPGATQMAGRYRGRLYAWEGPDWKTFRELRVGGRRDLTGLAYTPDGKRLAAACNDETVRVYDAATLEEVKKYTWKSGRLRSVAFSPDGTLAAAGSDTGKVVVWDVDE